MKLRSYIILFCTLTLSLAGCKKDESSIHNELDIISQVAYLYPDSAYRQWLILSKKGSKMEQDEIAHYNLSYIHIAYQNGMTFYNDELISKTINYYSKAHWNDSLKSYSFYYGGEIYNDLGDIQKAMFYYHKALETKSKQNSERLSEDIYRGLAKMFNRIGLYNQETENLRKALIFAKQTKDSISIIHCSELLASAYHRSGQRDKAIHLHNTALRSDIYRSYIKSVPKIAIASAAYNNLTGNYDESDSILKAITPQNIPLKDKGNYLSVAAETALLKSDTINAISYLERLINSSPLPDATKAATILASVRPTKHNVGHALLLSNSIYFMSNKSITRCMEASMTKIHDFKPLYTANTDTIPLQIIVFFSFILTAAIISLTIWVLGKHNDLKRLSVTLKKICHKRKDKIPFKHRLTDNEQIKTFIYHVQTARKCTTKEWDILSETIKITYPEFYNLFYSSPAISINERRVATLIKLGFPVKEIAKIMCKSENGISTIKSRLSKKLYNNDKATARDLDRIISSL